MADLESLIEQARQRLGTEGDLGRKTALVTGSVALGALLTGTVFRKLRHVQLKEPDDLPAALNAEIRALEMMEGRACFYQRDGSGTPIVLLHSINAAGSSYEMKPLFDHLVRTTRRPIFALDWLGFGRSDRPPVRYSPPIYLRQLRRFLSEIVHQSADIVAFSLAAEYAAEISNSLPYLVRKLVLVSPTGVSTRPMASIWQRALVSASDSVGAFEIFYYRLTRPELLRRFYERQIFRSREVPSELVEYARTTTQVKGAHYAPRYFVQGELSTGSTAFYTYAQLSVPTLITAPEQDLGLIQQFDALENLAARNPSFIEVKRMDGGLMPQWETPFNLFEAIDRFLSD